jgi:hypothetical protein
MGHTLQLANINQGLTEMDRLGAYFGVPESAESETNSLKILCKGALCDGHVAAGNRSTKLEQ